MVYQRPAFGANEVWAVLEFEQITCCQTSATTLCYCDTILARYLARHRCLASPPSSAADQPQPTSSAAARTSRRPRIFHRTVIQPHSATAYTRVLLFANQPQTISFFAAVQPVTSQPHPTTLSQSTASNYAPACRRLRSTRPSLPPLPS